MTLRRRILLAVALPAVAAAALVALLVATVVRADRLADLDATLASRAAAVVSYVEYDGGWEVDELPEHVVEPLLGYEVVADGVRLTGAGELTDRTWTGRFEVESDDEAERWVEVRVSQDVAPVNAALNRLLAELALVGLGVAAAAAAVGALWSRHLVASDDFRRLEAAWARQAAFTADAAHELRTPVAVVRTQAEVALRQEREPDAYRAALDQVRIASVRMQDLLDGLLFLARAGDRVDTSTCDLAEAVRGALARARPRPGVDLVGAVPETAEGRGDARLIGILVDNLLSNALRHTSTGTVAARLAPDPGGGWRLEVEDTGEGIPPEHVERVFERFHRVDPARARSDGGAGLGLAIARAITERHGGTIHLRSTLGAGTCVTVRLPRA